MAGSNDTKRRIRVFIASPSDVAVERRAFKDTIDELNAGFGRGADVEFVPLGWEDTLSQVGHRAQSAINVDVDACDVFVLVMWRRWGQDTPDAAPHTSYTEEEYHRALDRFKESGEPTIFVFFKHIDAGQEANPKPQLAKVLAFRKKLEQTHKVLYRSFADVNEFKQEIDEHLVAFARGETAPPAEKAALLLAKRAAKAALEGKTEQARQDFATALDGTTNLDVLYLGYKFFFRIGEFDEAEQLAMRRLAISGPQTQTADTARAYGNLGLIHDARGELDEAEGMHCKALAIEEKLGRPEGMARAYTNLGLIHRQRRELDEAVRMQGKALAIYERLSNQEAMASCYGNLGVIHLTLGELDQAERMLRKSLAINEKLGRAEGMSGAYCNLGLIREARGELDEAERMLRKSLAIDEKLDRLEAMAINYLNLGKLRKQRGDIAGARELWTTARDLCARIGTPQMVDQLQGWLDDLDGPPGASE